MAGGGGKGIIFVISAPSGAGKTTLVRRLVERVPRLTISVSYTTRPPRPNEREGVDYFFVSRAAFRTMQEGGGFIEWAEVHGDLYGTPRKNLEVLKEGGHLVLEIDTQGARQIKEACGDGVFIFILPPSMQELHRRLVERGGDSEGAIRARLRNANKELDQIHWYDYIVVNDDIEEATERLACIVRAEECRACRVRADFYFKGGADGKDHG